jgi:hypothetical protein
MGAGLTLLTTGPRDEELVIAYSNVLSAKTVFVFSKIRNQKWDDFF